MFSVKDIKDRATVNDEIIRTPTNIKYFDPFLVWCQNFYMSFSTKKKNRKLNLEKDRLNLLNMRRKISERGKEKIILTIWKIENIEKIELFSQQ